MVQPVWRVERSKKRRLHSRECYLVRNCLSMQFDEVHINVQGLEKPADYEVSQEFPGIHSVGCMITFALLCRIDT